MIHLENARVLVTGGAGFVGSNLVKRLIHEGARVTVLDDLFTGRLENLPKKGFDFVEGSVCDPTMVEKLVNDTEVVFHAAARNIVVSTKNPREDFETNIGGTLNILLAVKATNGRVKRVLYTSSTSVYGNPKYLPINEDDHLSLLTPYAVSKLGGENYCMAFYESYGVPTAAVRYSNVYGPGQDPANPYCGVVAKFIECLFEGWRPRSTVTACRRATSLTSTTRSRRRSCARRATVPWARCSMSARASRRASMNWPKCSPRSSAWMSSRSTPTVVTSTTSGVAS